MTPPASRRPSFHGEGGTLFGIVLVNLLLTLVTLGIYSFWGRTRVRKYLWGSTEFEGDRFAYHGTGKELLMGYLKALLVFFVLGMIIGVIGPALGTAGQILSTLVYLVAIVGLVPIAVYGARRYRLSRTSWRGIRFSLRGNVGDFVRMYVPGVLLTGLTLSLYTPYFQNNVRKYFADHTYFGTHRFGYDGEGGDLFGPYVIALLLTIPTLGLYWLWYTALRERYLWEHTTFGPARFRSTITGGGLFGIAITSFLLLIVTLGIAAPWVIVRLRRYYAECLELEGALDLAQIQQDARSAGGTAEGFADILDTGGIDVGL